MRGLVNSGSCGKLFPDLEPVDKTLAGMPVQDASLPPVMATPRCPPAICVEADKEGGSPATLLTNTPKSKLNSPRQELEFEDPTDIEVTIDGNDNPNDATILEDSQLDALHQRIADSSKHMVEFEEFKFMLQALTSEFNAERVARTGEIASLREQLLAKEKTSRDPVNEQDDYLPALPDLRSQESYRLLQPISNMDAPAAARTMLDEVRDMVKSSESRMQAQIEKSIQTAETAASQCLDLSQILASEQNAPKSQDNVASSSVDHLLDTVEHLRAELEGKMVSLEHVCKKQIASSCQPLDERLTSFLSVVEAQKVQVETMHVCLQEQDAKMRRLISTEVTGATQLVQEKMQGCQLQDLEAAVKKTMSGLQASDNGDSRRIETVRLELHETIEKQGTQLSGLIKEETAALAKLAAQDCVRLQDQINSTQDLIKGRNVLAEESHVLGSTQFQEQLSCLQELLEKERTSRTQVTDVLRKDLEECERRAVQQSAPMHEAIQSAMGTAVRSTEEARSQGLCALRKELTSLLESVRGELSTTMQTEVEARNSANDSVRRMLDVESASRCQAISDLCNALAGCQNESVLEIIRSEFSSTSQESKQSPDQLMEYVRTELAECDARTNQGLASVRELLADSEARAAQKLTTMQESVKADSEESETLVQACSRQMIEIQAQFRAMQKNMNDNIGEDGIVLKGFFDEAKQEFAQGVNTLAKDITRKGEYSMEVETLIQGMVVDLQGSVKSIESRLDAQLPRGGLSIEDALTKCRDLSMEAIRTQTMELSEHMAESLTNVRDALAHVEAQSASKSEEISCALCAHQEDVASLISSRATKVEGDSGSASDEMIAVLEKVDEQNKSYTKDLTDLGELVLSEIADVRSQTEEKWVMVQKDLEIERGARGVDTAANQSAIAAITRLLAKGDSLRSPSKAPVGFSP